jgi:predicted DsbA family dithiol-disulfide isomerase
MSKSEIMGRLLVASFIRRSPMRRSPAAIVRICVGFALLLGLCFVAGGNNVSAQSKIAAVIDGRTIPESEVDREIISQLFPLQQQIYAIRKAALENLISRTVLEIEARKRGVSVEELRKQLSAGKVEVSSSQVEALYLENASVFAAMSPDEAKERLRLDSESQEHMKLYRDALTKLRNNLSIELRLEEPRLPFIVEGAAPVTGPKEARVTIVEFSDFQCPYCRESQATLKQVLQTYKDEVRLVFKHLPLEIHGDAFSSAQAAFCAGEQGRFWQYHDALFTSELLSAEALEKIASHLGLNMSRFKLCLTSEASRAAVLKDVREAKQFGIGSTPTFVINRRLFRGALSFENFKTAIDEEIKSRQRDSQNQ